jgi:hypothetical protein
MDIQFTDNRFFLSDIKLTLDHDYSTILTELKAEQWTPQGVTQYVGQENDAFHYRWLIKDMEPKSKILKSILTYIQSDSVHNLALDSLYSYNPQFEGLWGMNKDKMKVQVGILNHTLIIVD